MKDFAAIDFETANECQSSMYAYRNKDIIAVYFLVGCCRL